MIKLSNITKISKISKPCTLGDNLLILATSPEVNAYLHNEEVREYFKEYDVAVVNKMPLCSESEMKTIRPKYIIFSDNIFYLDSINGVPNERKIWVEEVLTRIDWDCYIVIPFLATYQVSNPKIKYIYLNILEMRYNQLADYFYKKNIANSGGNTVVMSALYFGITFGYKQIGILGFTYRSGYGYMDEDGWHYDGYIHYYDEKVKHNVIKNDDIFTNGEDFLLWLAKRGVKSRTILRDIALYAKKHNSNITNYTFHSNVDTFKYCGDVERIVARNDS